MGFFWREKKREKKPQHNQSDAKDLKGEKKKNKPNEKERERKGKDQLESFCQLSICEMLWVMVLEKRNNKEVEAIEKPLKV